MVQMRGKIFGALTIMLVLIIVFCVKGTVMSREEDGRGWENHYYADLEQKYIDNTRQLLQEEGLKNCGVNLRWVTDENGNREYTILLHHRRLNRMSEEKKTILTDLLSEIEFRDEKCSFYYVLGIEDNVVTAEGNR